MKQNPVFDYRALRLLMGLIALLIAPVVSTVSSTVLASVSASYYTEARDAFVGALFIVGAFLWAYNGHTPTQKVASKIASIAAIVVAIVPTTKLTCEMNLSSIIHAVAAALLFSILAYFCFGPFRTKLKDAKGKRAGRRRIYFACGCIMVACIVVAAIATLTMDCKVLEMKRIIYWAEAIALTAFGVAWIVAGKVIPLLVDEDQAWLLANKEDE